MNLPAILVLIELVFEMVVFTILVMPTTMSLRHSLLSFLKTKPAKQILHGWRISLIGITVLFADGVRSVLQKREMTTDLAMNDKIAMGKLLAQRNLYLCGFTMFLAL